MRPGLAGLPRMEMTWDSYGGCSGLCIAGHEPAAPPCTLSNHCVANPVMQTVGDLPGGTSEPHTVITEYAVSKFHLQPSLNGWLIQAPAPLTTTQVNAARQFALTYKVTVETKASGPSLGEITDEATALGILIAFGVLAASVGLIRSETARDLRTLTATGASPATRRMITAATAAALGLLGAVLGITPLTHADVLGYLLSDRGDRSGEGRRTYDVCVAGLPGRWPSGRSALAATSTRSPGAGGHEHAE